MALELKRTLRRVAIVLGGCLALLIVSAAFVYLDGSRKTRALLAAPHPEGRIVQSDGVRLFARVRGQGKPAVIIEAGLSPAVEWWPVADQLAQHTQVVTYDRAGWGFSAPSSSPRTADQITRELRALLSALAIEPPYVLVGESIGALYAQHFARTHANEIAGLVLVHPITTDHGRFESELPGAEYQNLFNLRPRMMGLATLAQLGLLHLAKPLPYQAFVPPDAALLRSLYAIEPTYRAMAAEHRMLHQSIEQTASASELSAPLVVVHHCSKCFVRELTSVQMAYDDAESIEQLWRSISLATAESSPHGRMIEATRSSRYLHVAEPELVSGAVLELIR
jgi:pimeloyl-ACP methyl ester carboxylesterase